MMISRTIPSSGEQLPVVGLGTWQTFDVADASSNKELTEVLNRFHASGGRLIDSSPMYGKAEQAIGELTSTMEEGNDYFYATKVWTTGKSEGIQQMERSFALMQRRQIDLMQIHNLVDWKTHLPVLRKWKEEGRIRYIGITHYTDANHAELEKVLTLEKIDFVQFNYSIASRHAEKRLLDASAALGVATIINRPFGEGELFRKVSGKELPDWARETGIKTWSDFFLKYIIAHPAVTCVIPATSNPEHAIENCNAGSGELPNVITRLKMVNYISEL